MFFTLQARWGGAPFEVANDGEVTALAGSMSLYYSGRSAPVRRRLRHAGGQHHALVNELAFAPVDYRAGRATSGPATMGVACSIFRNRRSGGWRVPPAFPSRPRSRCPEQLVVVQEAMHAGDKRARAIFETIGVCFGYAIAHYADFYELRNLLILGRVTSGEGRSSSRRRPPCCRPNSPLWRTRSACAPRTSRQAPRPGRPRQACQHCGSEG